MKKGPITIDSFLRDFEEFLAREREVAVIVADFWNPLPTEGRVN